jgi:NADP-dependent 3-hydroxy acid dehydrogenase YdfG
MQEVLPHFRSRNDGHIINVSSQRLASILASQTERAGVPAVA